MLPETRLELTYPANGMGKENGDAGATTAANAAGGETMSSEDLAFLQTLEAEETAGRSAETNDSESGSPQGETAEEADGQDADEADDAASAVAEDEADASEGDDGTEDGEDAEDGEEPEFKGRVQKRISKLVAQRKQLEAERDELKAEVDRYKSGAPQPTGPWNPLDADPDYAASSKAEQSARSEYQSARALLKRLDRQPDDAVAVIAKAFKRENLTEDQARDLLEDYAETQQERLTDAKAKRVARETEIRNSNAQAAKIWQSEAEADMPWIKNQDDPRQKHLVALKKAHPWVEQIPAGAWILAVAAHKLAVMDARARQARKAPRTTDERRIVPTTGRTTGGIRPVPPKSKALAAAAKRHEENPSDESLTEYLGAVVGG